MLQYSARKIVKQCTRRPISRSVTSLEKCINEVRLLGRVGRDPVVSEGEDAITFSVATSYPRKIKAEDGSIITREPSVTWHEVTAVRARLKEYIRLHIRKGRRVLCDGNLLYRVKYGRDGEMIKRANILLYDIIVLGDPHVRRREDIHQDGDDEEEEDTPGISDNS